MNWEIREHQLFGTTLFADNGTVELGIPLNYGLRINHLSLCGGENLFFEQPADMTDLTMPEGWRVRGGHRIWLAPENYDDYYPDNDPIHYEIVGEEIRIWQDCDPWLQVKKYMYISFIGENQVRVLHRVENASDHEIHRSVWTISSMAGGGVENIKIGHRAGGYDPWYKLCMWDYTNVGDPRAQYSKEEIELTFMPIEGNYKIGVGHPMGPVTYKNKGVIFEKSFLADRNLNYPDGNVSYETFFCKHMVEIESLSPMQSALPGDYMEHEEIWTLRAVE